MPTPTEELVPLRDLSEEEYWAEYRAALERCDKANLRCECCNKPLMQCPHWQQLRLIFNPSPSERKLLDSK